MQLYEKYRPETFEAVVGQDKAVKKIQGLTSGPWGGQAFFISGASGTGKTTLAWLIARMGADDFYIQEYRSGRDISARVLDDIERTMHLYSLCGGKTGRAFIINEAHGMRADIIERFLGLLEPIPSHVVFIFTTTKEAQAKLFDGQLDSAPLLSRCHEIALTNQGLCKSFAQHVKAIAEREGLDGKPLSAYEQLARDCHNNCRAMIQAVQEHRMEG